MSLVLLAVLACAPTSAGASGFANIGPSLLDLVAPDQPPFVLGTQYSVLPGSGSGDVTARLVPVGPISIPPGGFDTSASACQPSDFAGFPPGSVALIQRGFCARADKVANAVAAGASGVVMFNEGTATRTGLLTAGVEQVSIPVVGTTYQVGVDLRNLTLAGPVIIHVVTHTFSLTTKASPSVGGAISDTATLAGGTNPTGTITFSLFGPGDTTCTAAPVTTSTRTVAGNGTYTSGLFSPAAPGTYRYTARYSGDGINPMLDAGCGESVVVKPVPALATKASPSVPVGGTIADTATLTGGASAAGTITFDLFGPDNGTCSGTPISTSAKAVAGDGAYTSDGFTATVPGTYRFIARYSGDANYEARSGACNDPDESVVVTAASTSVDTTPPVVSGFAETNRKFTVGKTSTPTSGAAAKSTPSGTTFKYTLSEAATATIDIQRAAPGRRKGSKCVKPTAKLKKAKKCTRATSAGKLTRTSHQGANAVMFSGRIGSKKLTPGNYLAVLTAKDGAGNQSAPKTIKFTIVKH